MRYVVASALPWVFGSWSFSGRPSSWEQQQADSSCKAGVSTTFCKRGDVLIEESLDTEFELVLVGLDFEYRRSCR